MSTDRKSSQSAERKLEKEAEKYVFWKKWEMHLKRSLRRSVRGSNVHEYPTFLSDATKIADSPLLIYLLFLHHTHILTKGRGSIFQKA